MRNFFFVLVSMKASTKVLFRTLLISDGKVNGVYRQFSVFGSAHQFP